MKTGIGVVLEQWLLFCFFGSGKQPTNVELGLFFKAHRLIYPHAARGFSRICYSFVEFETLHVV